MALPNKLATAAAIFGSLLMAGCGPTGNQRTGRGGDIGDLGGHVKRGMVLPESQNDLRQLAVFCQSYRAEHNRFPNTEELKAYIGREAPKLVQALEQSRYILAANAKAESSSILAYEKAVDLNGNQGTVTVDGAFKLMKAEDLQAALRRQGG